MLDIKWIRENDKEFDNLLIKRGLAPRSQEIIKLDEERRQLVTLIQQLQQAKNKKSSLLADKGRTTKESEEIKRDVGHINEKLDELNVKLQNDNILQNILENLPNLPAPEVPHGVDESMNKLIRTIGVPKKDQLYSLPHERLGEQLEMIDFIQTAKISGSRFVTLKGDLARLERALINFMLDVHIKEFGFEEISPPYLVKPSAMYNVGLLPKFSEDSFETINNYRLIPTGEVPLANMVADSIIAREVLPLRYVAYTPCFRSEAGSAGRDARGMIRMHQFSKVELVSITSPEEAETEHEYIVGAAEEILKKLELPYRVMLLCSGDMGFQSKKTYDIEVWVPSQKMYREISSCSNCGDFQARRMKARYKEFNSTENKFVHTLNGSALAIGRTIIAIMENYQNEDGSITIPKVLQNYMGGMTKIEIPQNK